MNSSNTRIILFVFSFFINGMQVGCDWFTPGNSQYRETMCYMKYDVTDMLHEGVNAMGAELAGGWFTGYMTFTASNFNFFGDHEALLAKLVIRYEDGSIETIVTDPDTWKTYKDGPVRLGSFFQGERYDAGKIVEGWSEAGFDDSGWSDAEKIRQREWMDFDIGQRLKKESPAAKTMFVTLADGPYESGYIYSNKASHHLTFQVIGSRLQPGYAENGIIDAFHKLYGESEK